LREPLDLVQQAVVRSADLTGRERLRVLIEAMLESLEVYDGVAITVLDPRNGVTDVRSTLAEAAVPDIAALLAGAGDDAQSEAWQLRVAMAVAAVEAAVRRLMVPTGDHAGFLTRLRAQRADIVEAALRLLDPPPD
ncbi:MAG: hypothetical protein ACRCY8_08035, partial [Dermatophilaceae bacterium]